MSKLITILSTIFIGFGLMAMDDPRDRLHRDMAENGHMFFEGYADNPLGQAKVEELAEIMDRLAVISRLKEYHHHAYYALFDYEILRHEPYKLTGYKSGPKPTEKDLKTLAETVEELLSFMAPEDRERNISASLIYFDDLKKSVEEKVDFHDMQNKESTEIFILPPLNWHQDRFAGDEEGQYENLFFMVLNTRGFTPHYCQIGLAEETMMHSRSATGAKFAKEQEEVITIKQILCQSGAGYGLNQKKVVDGKVYVHGHNGAKTYLSNRTKLPADCETLKPEEHNVRRKYTTYKAPRRGVLILRLKFIS